MDTLTQLRDRENEYKRRNVQPLLVLAQQTFQLKRPKKCHKDWAWPGDRDIPTELLFDPLSTVSATYGVAFQTQFRDENVWSSRPTIFVIDRDGVLRHVDSHHEEDIREEGIFPALDDLQEQRKLIMALQKDEARRQAATMALAPFPPPTGGGTAGYGHGWGAAIPPLVKALKDEDAQVRAGAAAALYWIAPAAGPVARSGDRATTERAEAAVPALSEALRDTDKRVRRLSALALARIGPGSRSAVPALMEALKDPDARVRAATAEALRGIGPPARAAVPALMEALKDPDLTVRAAAANALAAIGPGAQAATRALIEALKTQNEQVHLAAAEALKKIDPEAAKKAGID